MSRKALFLDRDGVVNTDFGYVHKKCDFEFIPGIFELVRRAEHLGYLIFVVTNQAGIGRGFYSEDQFNELTAWMLNIFEREFCHISEVYYSPFHPTEGIGIYKKNDHSRKPNPGMILQAVRSWDLSPSRSIMVGDNESDMEAAFRADLGQRILVDKEDKCEGSTKATLIVSNIEQVISHIV